MLSTKEHLVEDALLQPSLCGSFQLVARANAERPALRLVGEETAVTWAEYARRVESIARGLYAIGVRPRDRVALLIANRPEFHLVDTALLHLGAAPFSVYHTNPSEQIVPLIDNSGAELVITEAEFAERIEQVARLRPDQIRDVVIAFGEPAAASGRRTLEELEALDAPDFDFEATWRAVERDTLATLVYTSGTTGAPKAVQFPHSTLFGAVQGMHALYPVSSGGRVVSYLPLAHIAGRYMTHYRSMFFGDTITCVPDPARLDEAFREAQQTWFFGVPRVWEKLAAAAQHRIRASEDLTAAFDAGLVRVRAEQSGTPLTESQARAAADADATLAPVREEMGLASVEWAGVATAPSGHDVLEFWHAVGVPIAETWGMSECMFGLATPRDRVCIGTVGVPVPGMEAKLLDDGEIVVRGPTVFPGYFRDEERTREVLDAEGWLHTGDLGAIGEDGLFRIVGRKKDIIINSAGKNMSPANIEGAIKQHSALIDQIVTIGDGRPYNTGLIAIDAIALERFAAARSLEGTFGELVRTRAVLDAVAAEVEAGNRTLARVEQIRKWEVLPHEWVPGGDELTSTSKLKRASIAEKYADVIDALYEQGTKGQNWRSRED